MPKVIVTLVRPDRTARQETVEALPGRTLLEEAAFQIIRHSAFYGSVESAVGTTITMEVID